jgi:carboxymethylenebutenolidase
VAEGVALHGADGSAVEAYLARPLDIAAVGGVVVVHHMPGLDRHTKEIVRRFAAEGYVSIAPNLYSREAPGLAPQEAFGVIWKQGGVDDDQVVADVGVAVAHVRSSAACSGRVAVIGYCSGGRQALLAACRLNIDAAVDCYGSFVIEPPKPELGLRIGPIVGELDCLRCPVLGLFGADDTDPSPAEVDTLAALLRRHDKEYEFHVHDHAGHAFFATERPTYRVEAAAVGWQRVLEFLERHLA